MRDSTHGKGAVQMQNRYAGDAGDFGKIGLLRNLANSGLRVGVNWYLVADEAHNEDGKHTGYLHDPKFTGCDDELLGKLGCIVYGNQRNVHAIQELELVPSAAYYCGELLPPEKIGSTGRKSWHESAQKALGDTDIVFLDPDNGLLPKSVSPSGSKSVKYVLQQEIADYYATGHSVVFYNHRWHMEETQYLAHFLSIFQASAFCGAHVLGLKYVRGTVRDYFFLLQPQHAQRAENSIQAMLSSRWSRHFIKLPIGM